MIGRRWVLAIPASILILQIGIFGIVISSLPYASAQDNPVIYRALILQGNETFNDDTEELVSGLEKPRFGDPQKAWYSSVKGENILGKRWSEVRDIIKDHFKEADSNDVSLIIMSTTGTKVKDGVDKDDKNTNDKKLGNCKILPCDEALATIGRVGDGHPKFIRDDSFDDLFQPFKAGDETRFNGPKIIVISACYCGGLADGTLDLPVDNSVVLMAAGTNEISWESLRPFKDDVDEHGVQRRHMVFLGFLIAGLADNGAGKARAAGGDNTLTVGEWFDYASPKVTAAQSNQHPVPKFDKGSRDWVVLKYNDGTLIQHSEEFSKKPSKQKKQCDCEGETCPIEEDDFSTSIAEIEILDLGTVMLSGPTIVIADIANVEDSDGDGLEQVQTEIVIMELTGSHPLLGDIQLRLRDQANHPFQRSMGEIEETINNTPGVLDISPFTRSGSATSFFDVFFEIEVPGIIEQGDEVILEGQIFHNDNPKRMQAIITCKPPCPGETYENFDVIDLFDENEHPTGIKIKAALHTPNPLGPPQPPRVVGGKILPIDATSLFVARALTNTYWILPMFGGIAGVMIAIIRTKRKLRKEK